MWRGTAVIASLLLLLSGLAWVVLIKQWESMAIPGIPPPEQTSSISMPGMGDTPPSQPVSLTTRLHGLLLVHPGMGGVHPLLFLAIWVLMMVAMMFPSVAPMVIGFVHISRNKGSLATSWGTVGAFVAGYLGSWAAAGVAALLLQLMLVRALQDSTPVRVLQLTGGTAVIAAGVYQFTPWKRVCLSYCRTPLSFFLHAWRPGIKGALEMGTRHGAFCAGCCWGLMLVLFVTGLMNLAWMAALSVIIGVEKLTPVGNTAARILGGAFVAIGGLITVVS
jgi:predicted metal-binding membrane protein